MPLNIIFHTLAEGSRLDLQSAVKVVNTAIRITAIGMPLHTSIMALLRLTLRCVPTNLSRAAMSTSAKTAKVKYFEALTSDWWDPNGRLGYLHLLMPFRKGFILDQLQEKGLVKPGSRPLDGLEVLDVGCGAGLISESLAALGANVTGIDPCDAMIRVANEHARAHPPPTTSQLQYIVSTPEEFVLKSSKKYDVIVVFLVLEHIDLHKEFLTYCTSLLKPNGSIFIHHLNKTWRSRLWHLLWHMHVTKLIPMAVATYSQLVPINDIIAILKTLGCGCIKSQGINATFLGNRLYLTKSSKYFNFIHAIKTSKLLM